MTSPREQALRVLLDEARSYVEYQFRTIQDIEVKAGQVIRFDAVVGGLVFAGISLVARGGPAGIGALDLGMFGGALAALALSVLMASMAFARPDIAVGLRARRLEEVLAYDLDPEVLRERAVASYARGIHRNNERFIRRGEDRVIASLAMLLVALTLLFVAAIRLIVLASIG